VIDSNPREPIDVANLEGEVARSISFTVRAFEKRQQTLKNHQLLVMQSNRGLYSTRSQVVGAQLVVISGTKFAIRSEGAGDRKGLET
jgi:hypothetical protein